MSPRVSFALPAAAVLAALAVGCGGDGRQAPAAPAPAAAPPAAAAPPVTEPGAGAAPARLVAPERVHHAPRVAATGTLKARQSSPLAMSVPGTLLRVAVARGQEVREGALLASLDDGAAAAGRRQAEAAVAAARAQLALAEDALARATRIREEEGVSEAQLVQARAQRDLAAAQLAAAEAQLEQARVHLAHHHLRAPFAGVVTRVPDGVGITVAPGVPVVTLVSTRALVLETSLTQEEAAGLRPGVRAVGHRPRDRRARARRDRLGGRPRGRPGHEPGAGRDRGAERRRPLPPERLRARRAAPRRRARRLARPGGGARAARGRLRGLGGGARREGPRPAGAAPRRAGRRGRGGPRIRRLAGRAARRRGAAARHRRGHRSSPRPADDALRRRHPAAGLHGDDVARPGRARACSATAGSAPTSTPTSRFPFVTITTVYPGASPEDIEETVTRPIEDAVSSISGVDQVFSWSREDVSIVFIEFKLSVPLGEAVQNVRDKVGVAQGQLPLGARAPVIAQYDVSAQPVLVFSAASGERSGRAARALRRPGPAAPRAARGRRGGPRRGRRGAGDLGGALPATGSAARALARRGLPADPGRAPRPARRAATPQGRARWACACRGEFRDVDELRAHAGRDRAGRLPRPARRRGARPRGRRRSRRTLVRTNGVESVARRGGEAGGRQLRRRWPTP